MTYRFGRGARSAHLMRRPSGVVVGGGVTLPTTDLLVALYANAGVTDDGGGPPPEVTDWDDQDSTSGPHHLTQATTTERPELDATAGPEGGPAIAFGAQSTDSNGHLNWSSAVTSVASAHTYYFVLNCAATGGGQYLSDFQTGRELCILDRSGSLEMYDGTFRIFGAAPTTGWQCLTYQADTTLCRAFRARSQVGTDQTWGGDKVLGGASMSLGASISGANPFNGHMAAVLIYDRAHDATERGQVWDYLASLYPSVGL